MFLNQQQAGGEDDEASTLGDSYSMSSGISTGGTGADGSTSGGGAMVDGVRAELLRNEEMRTTQSEKNQKMRDALASFVV